MDTVDDGQWVYEFTFLFITSYVAIEIYDCLFSSIVLGHKIRIVSAKLQSVSCCVSKFLREWGRLKRSLSQRGMFILEEQL